MPIDTLCAKCGKTLRVGDEFEGRQARCPVCQNVYVVRRETSLLSDAQGPRSAPASNSGDRDTVYQPFSANTTNASSSIPANVPSPVQPSSVSSTMSEPQSVPGSTYYVRTPNAATYGPANGDTVLDWIEQGRLDDTCHIRLASANDWLSIPEWRAQQAAPLRTTPTTRPGVNPYSGSQPAGGYQFGAGQIPGNQSTGYLKTGGGMIVLVLGLLSWVLCFTVIGGPICSIAALVMGWNELKNIRDGRSDPGEKTTTIIGMVLAALCLMTVLGFVMLAIIGAALDA